MDNLGYRKDTPITGLIDADILAYKCAAVSDYQQMDWDDTILLVQDCLQSWTQFCDTFVLCFSDSQNFRKIAYPDYKAHRADKPKPFYLEEIVTYLKEHYPCADTIPYFEADDILGFLMSTRENVLCISTDKDLRQIAGWHWNPDKERWPTRVSRDEAIDFANYQILVGDPSDGYGGAPGIGPKKAEKILKTEEGILKYFPTLDDFYKTVHLSTILTSDELPSWFTDQFPHLVPRCTQSTSGSTEESQGT